MIAAIARRLVKPKTAADPIEEEPGGFGCLESSRGALPLESLDVRARVVGVVSQVTVRQGFVNVHDEALEQAA